MAAPAGRAYSRSQTESETTLSTIVELVRRILHADTTSIVSLSSVEHTITWKAASGFRAYEIDVGDPLVQQIANTIAQRALLAESIGILQGVGSSEELPSSDFPVHTAEGIRDLAFVPLTARGHKLGSLMVGFRSAHTFTEEEKRLLQDLAGIAAVALDNARLVERVSAAEEIWVQTFDAIGEGILVHDRQMRIVRCNRRAAEIIDMDVEEIIGMPFRDIFGRVFGRRAADYYLRENRATPGMFEVESESGRRYLMSIFPFDRADGDLVSVVTWNDVTQLSEIQEQLARTRRLASLGQLAAGVAHEINNPLAAITTCAEAIMRGMREDNAQPAVADQPAKWNQYLEQIVRQSLRCKEITRGLLDLTRQREPRSEPCDINVLARQCAKLAVQAAGPAIEFDINLDESVGEVATDAAMVVQVVDNLVMNALQAVGEAGKITISTRRVDDRVTIEVADTGQGIPADVLPRIFDPFFSTKGPGKGYGLGLAICASIAESLNGAVTVESKEGAGSCFRLWLPRRVAPGR